MIRQSSGNLHPPARPAMNGARLVCPADRTSLVERGAASAWECPACSKTYRVVGGVVQFLDSDDSFYEGTYLNQVHYLPRGENLLLVWPVWLINNGYLWRVRRHVAAGSTVLELGCAGGIAYFARRYRMIGLDVSMKSLQAAAGHYETCLKADASSGIPLADGSVDAVASSFFWEHIPADDKRRILAELRRVLRPGGRLIFLYDVETENPLVSSLRRRNPLRYKKEFIDRDGHLGYQTPEDNLALFRSEGFRVIEQLGLERTPLQSTTVYSKMSEWPRPWATAGSILKGIDRSRATLFSWIALLRTVDETVGRLLPAPWARMALTVCEKELSNGKR